MRPAPAATNAPDDPADPAPPATAAVAEQTPWPVLRRLTTFARATQNVVSPAPAAKPVTLVLVAAVDRPRDGIARRLGVPLAAVTVAALALVSPLVAIRAALDAGGPALGAVQLP